MIKVHALWNMYRYLIFNGFYMGSGGQRITLKLSCFKNRSYKTIAVKVELCRSEKINLYKIKNSDRGWTDKVEWMMTV